MLDDWEGLGSKIFSYNYCPLFSYNYWFLLHEMCMLFLKNSYNYCFWRAKVSLRVVELRGECVGLAGFVLIASFVQLL